MFQNVLTAHHGARYVPEFDCTDEFEGVRSLTLEGEPFQGKKTKVFAYYGLPKNVSGKVPAVVLVHGGGGHPFCLWVKMWNERGYAAIAVDTTGYMPKELNAGAEETHELAQKWERELSGVFAEEGYIPGPNNDSMKIDGVELQDQWMFHAVSVCIKANTFLREQPEIDTEKIGVVGISWGGVITSILLGYDHRFAFGVPIYGSGYLAEGLSDIDRNFDAPSVRERWLAETRFDTVKQPVLWLAWNDDSAFSVHSNSLSYLATVKNNRETRLSFVNEMYHSHWRAWVREEAFAFADAVVSGTAFPSVIDHSAARDLNVEIAFEAPFTLKSATLYYIPEKMTYTSYAKFGGDTPGSFMAQTWQTKPLTVANNRISEKLPAEAVGYYTEVIFTNGDKKISVTSPYREDAN